MKLGLLDAVFASAGEPESAEAALQRQLVDWAYYEIKDSFRRVETPSGCFWITVAEEGDRLNIQIGNSRAVDGNSVPFVADFKLVVQNEVLRVVTVDRADLPQLGIAEQPWHPYTEPPVGPADAITALRAVLDPILRAVLESHRV